MLVFFTQGVGMYLVIAGKIEREHTPEALVQQSDAMSAAIETLRTFGLGIFRENGGTKT